MTARHGDLGQSSDPALEEWEGCSSRSLGRRPFTIKRSPGRERGRIPWGHRVLDQVAKGHCPRLCPSGTPSHGSSPSPAHAPHGLPSGSCCHGHLSSLGARTLSLACSLSGSSQNELLLTCLFILDLPKCWAVGPSWTQSFFAQWLELPVARSERGCGAVSGIPATSFPTWPLGSLPLSFQLARDPNPW